ncbi:MAG: molybdate ABC transporter substrate-binding protein [Desulfococcaceae bacterium]
MKKTKCFPLIPLLRGDKGVCSGKQAKCFLLAVLTFFLIPCVVCGAEEITVSAAASLTNAMTKAGQSFENANPGIKVIFNFAASGALLQQIKQGAPVDVFASADQKSMDMAEAEKLVLPETRKNFVKNTLVLAVPADSALTVKSPEDLKQSGIKKIAVGNPETVPAGRYARESLTGYGLWDVLTDKFIYASTVRQVLDYLIRGEVDAGFVYSTDAAVAGEKVKVMLEMGKHKPVIYPIAVVSASEKKESAQRLMDFVLSDAGQAVFAEFGFSRPE